MLFGSSVALQESALLANMFLGLGGSLFFSPSPLGQAKSGSGFHTGHGWCFSLSEGMSSSFCVWVPFFLSNLAVFCLGWLKSVLRFCGWRVAPVFSAVSLRTVVRFFFGFGFRLARGSLFSSLSLSSLVVPFFFCSLARPRFFKCPVRFCVD